MGEATMPSAPEPDSGCSSAVGTASAGNPSGVCGPQCGVAHHSRKARSVRTALHNAASHRGLPE